MQNFDDIWEPALQLIAQNTNTVVLNLWFRPLVLIRLTEDSAVFTAPNDFKADIVRKKHAPVIANALEEILGFPVKIFVLSTEHGEVTDEAVNAVLKGLPQDIPAEPEKEHEHEKEVPAVQKQEEPEQTLTPDDPVNIGRKEPEEEYTFETFIVGNSNRLAYSVSQAVANHPSTKYNPLFIHGPSGLGKTHLLCAITDRVHKNNPKAKVISVKGEAFTNELIDAIYKNQTNSFREKYRQADVFLIDDVQFIAGKEATQLEFFNTFNDLYEAHKQIILTSDRPPKEIKTLEERLRTRFEWGLIVDVQPPDYELRIAILRKKAEALGIEIPMEVLSYLGENVKNNIRQLEGVIKKIDAYANLTGQPVTVDMAKIIIADVVSNEEVPTVTKERVLATVARKYGISQTDIVSKKRTADVAMARHVCIYILREISDMSLPQIGKEFGRDHSTVMSSLDTVAKKRKEDSVFDQDIDEMIRQLKKK